MDSQAEAPVTEHKSTCEANSIQPSTHDDTGGICTDEGRIDEVHNRTVSHTPEPNATRLLANKRFCTFAVDTGLTGSPGLPPELRLRVYQAAFPEMDRPIVNEDTEDISDKNTVYIRTTAKCKDCWDGRDCYRHPQGYRDNQFENTFTSNFARDPTTRVEFLTEYLRRVQIVLLTDETETDCDHRKGNSYPWRFLSMLAASGLLGEMKHFAIATDRTIVRRGRSYVPGDCWDAPIGHMLAVLFRFKVKCELSFIMHPPAYKPIVDHLTEVVKANLSRDEIDKYFTSSCSDGYHDKYLKKTNKLFNQDKALLKLIYRLRNTLWDEIDEHFDGYSILEYAIDFSE